MTRVSLKEAYDNKDVVAQIYAIRDIAEGAEDTADSAVTTANTASAHVDELVPQVEGAVQNANNASASAQASAQTVAGYENRLSAVEGETAGLDSDLNAVTLRVTTAEGQIVTIQGRVTALEGADAQNVKLAGPQSITGIKTVPTEPTGTLSQQIANSAKIGAELDNYAPMVRTTDNQTVRGKKAMWTPYYNGTFPSSPDKSSFTDLGRVFSTGSFGNVAFSIVGRGDYAFGVLTGSHDAGTGTVQTDFVGEKSSSAKVSIGFSVMDDGVHLLACRTTSAGQGFTVQIFGIGNVTTAPDIEPELTYPTVTPGNYTEAILI